jgi:hypothetical protein
VNVDEFEQDVYRIAAEWSFLRSIETVDKTDYAVKLRLHIDTECFIQMYTNVEKGILSYVLVLNRARIFGRDNEGGEWHRHPHGDADQHDRSPAGRTAVTMSQFLVEVQRILIEEGLL